MTFDEILEQVIALLKRQGRVSYGALKRRFDLDDAYLEDLKGEILFAYPVIDEDGRGLVWTGDTASAQAVLSPPAQTTQPPATQAQPSPHGAPLAVRGYASDEVEYVYRRARDLSQEVDDSADR